MKISSFFKPLSFLPALLIMYMIYSFSAETGDLSSATSYKVSREVVTTYNNVTRQGWEEWKIDEEAGRINFYVRKAAHMTEYFLLAVAVSFPLYVYGVRGILLMLLEGIICVGYACGDEYHQAAVAGRVSSRRDVGIDSIGIMAGILLVRIFGWSARVAVTGPRLERKQRRMQEELDRREEELDRRERELSREEDFRRERELSREEDFRRRERELSGKEDARRIEMQATRSYAPRESFPEETKLYTSEEMEKIRRETGRNVQEHLRGSRAENTDRWIKREECDPEEEPEDDPEDDPDLEEADDIVLFRRRKVPGRRR